MNAIVTATRIGNYCLVCTFSSLAIQAIATNEERWSVTNCPLYKQLWLDSPVFLELVRFLGKCHKELLTRVQRYPRRSC